MIRMMLASVLSLIMVNSADGREVAIEPSALMRVVSPSDPHDARLLLKFEMPVGVTAANLVYASLSVQTSGARELPVVIGVVNAAWSDRDTWTTLDSRLADSGAFHGRLEDCLLVTNHMEIVNEFEVDSGLYVDITEIVQRWLNGTENYGLCIRRVNGRRDDLSGTLAGDLGPQLRILYTSR